MFFVNHITTINGATAKEMFDFADIHTAKEKFHSLSAYDYNSAVLPTMDYFLVVIHDEHGNKVAPEEYYKKPEPLPEPDVVEEEPIE